MWHLPIFSFFKFSLRYEQSSCCQGPLMSNHSLFISITVQLCSDDASMAGPLIWPLTLLKGFCFICWYLTAGLNYISSTIKKKIINLYCILEMYRLKCWYRYLPVCETMQRSDTKSFEALKKIYLKVVHSYLFFVMTDCQTR